MTRFKRFHLKNEMLGANFLANRVGVFLVNSVLIAAERERIHLQTVLSAIGDEPVAISVITASEMLHGIQRARTLEQVGKRQQFVSFILDLFPIIPVDLEVARHHARIWAELQARGDLIGAHDLLIAASALARSGTCTP